MKTYRIIEGYIHIKFTETELILHNEEKFPVSRFSMVVDLEDQAVVHYLLEHLGISTQEFVEVDGPLLFMPFQLN